MMEFSRAMLAAATSVLGILLYICAGLLLVLALVTLVRADPAGVSPVSSAVAAIVFSAAGFACRYLARRIA